MTAERKSVCCFSGHRASKLPWGENESDPRCAALKEELARTLESLYESGVRHFICGMALGSDMYFAEAVLALRDLHGDVTLEAAIPCPEQTERWSDGQKLRYEDILSRCDAKTVISHRYTLDCMDRRNRYMIDRSATLVTVYGGGRGGTFNTIRHALREGLRLIELEV